ncbi:e3 ubiquitin-protein ligase chfr [Plasmopara halstedii]|uniref:E3 ubiquitin-protein ligase CHFR n=1 Tax=Plasmopara halstedii TaxID=4781 RepID=A0A0P1AUJ5_PLAHL|nr:e3 ubiquitin-protein ligase chfr [Plasmopara halstedii]CEG45294.1 e3 ubiquitin-protein ligase chfr [Plasmopara halstedii]|eukprot:XP_024581663.1 e3 ubiquitin-protein ligase chfr [Plasmopara halstedii]
MVHDIAIGSWEFSTSFCVGRSRGCEVSIATSEETRTVSKRHASIVPVTETLTQQGQARRRWLIYDLKTLNGTAVNGLELSKGGNHELRSGDEVVLASAMRQCVRIHVQYTDEAHTRIMIKAMALSVALSPPPLHRRIIAQEASPRRSPCQNIMTNASITVSGSGRSAVTITDSPALTRIGCRSVGNTPNSETTMMTPPPHFSQKRNRSSPAAESENVAVNRQQNPFPCQQRKRSRRGIVFEDKTTLKKSNFIVRRARESEQDEQERLMMCPVCLDYFNSSATLPCSHTFCGLCISSWFRNSLSCPECRDIVKTLPIRNRALDELVEGLVGQKEAYKSLIRRRALMQRRLIEPYRYSHDKDAIEDESEGATRGVNGLQLGSNIISHHGLYSSVFTVWSVEEKLAFSACIAEQFGEARVATCLKIGLTDSAVDRANLTELLVAAQNLLLDSGDLRLVRDECSQRLKIFLFFG